MPRTEFTNANITLPMSCCTPYGEYPISNIEGFTPNSEGLTPNVECLTLNAEAFTPNAEVLTLSDDGLTQC